MLYFHKVCITEVKLKGRKQNHRNTMTQDELKKKMEDRLSEIRQKAVEIEKQIQEEKEAEEFAKMVDDERARQSAKKRTFANAQNADEADGLLPTMEELAVEYTNDKEEDQYRIKTKEEILENGTLIEKLRLYYSSADLSSYFGDNGTLTKEELAKIVASITTKEDKELVRQCDKEYNALRKYGEQLRFYFKRFQTSFAMLAVTLNRLDGYQNIVSIFNAQVEDIWKNDYSDKPEPEMYREHDLNMLNARATVLTTLDGAEILQDKGGSYFLNTNVVRGKPGLSHQIKREAIAVEEDLQDFKAFTDVVEEFIKGSKLLYMPISIQMSIENAEGERYARYLVKNLSFFRSELNERKERGESITREEERRAVIPDFYEVKPNEEVYRSCKKYIKDLMKENE